MSTEKSRFSILGVSGTLRRVSLLAAVLPLLAVLGLPALVFAEGESAQAADLAVSIIRGELVYLNACAGCHGRNGDGNGVAGPYLIPPPRDFTAGVYRFRSTPSGELPTDDDIIKSTAQGIPGTMMPAFKDLLSASELKDVVAYTKTFTQDFKEYGAGTPVVIPEETMMTKESISEGRQISMVLGCWTCHGPAGKGNGPSAGTQTDNKGNPLPPLNFVTGTYKMGSTPKEIYLAVNTGLDGSGMASYADLFSYGNTMDFKQFEQAFTVAEVESLKSYLGREFSTEQFNALSQEEKDKLIAKRKWALVHYITSLKKKPGIFHWLFGVTTDVTASR